MESAIDVKTSKETADLKIDRPENDVPSAQDSPACSEIINLYLIRHAETIDNVRHNYAGITDSVLTNHGALQTKALATYISEQDLFVTHIFSSDLQRAVQTAAAIHDAAVRKHPPEEFQWNIPFVQTVHLREKDFGSREGKNYLQVNPTKRAKTSSERVQEVAENEEKGSSIDNRCNAFIDVYLGPLITFDREPFHSTDEQGQHVKNVFIISHGITLAHLFRQLLSRFPRVQYSKEALQSGYEVNGRPVWSNTGYIKLQLLSREYQGNLRPDEGPRGSSNQTGPADVSRIMFHDYTCIVRGVNVVTHLKGLRRTGGGIGSSQFDSKQKSVMDFFKKTPSSSAGTKRPLEEQEEEH